MRKTEMRKQAWWFQQLNRLDKKYFLCNYLYKIIRGLDLWKKSQLGQPRPPTGSVDLSQIGSILNQPGHLTPRRGTIWMNGVIIVTMRTLQQLIIECTCYTSKTICDHSFRIDNICSIFNCFWEYSNTPLVPTKDCNFSNFIPPDSKLQ